MFSVIFPGQGSQVVGMSSDLYTKFELIKKLYKDHNIYFATRPEYSEILDGNPYIHKVIPYSEQLDDMFTVEGRGDHDGFFEVAYFPHVTTQKFISYVHNCKDKTDFNLQCTY